MNTPRWYIDADTLGLAHVLGEVRPDVTWPGDDGVRKRRQHAVPPCIITETSTPDRIWIPQVTRAGMVIITRDRMILSRRAEVSAVERSGARMFAITSNEQLRTWGLLEVVMSSWRRIEEQAAKPGPFICSVTRTEVRRIFPAT